MSFHRYDEWDGYIETSINGNQMRWEVLNVEEDDGILSLGGMTHGTKMIWNDCFWFEIIIANRPVEVRYYADREAWRIDLAVKTA